MPESENDLTLGEQLDLEQSLNLGNQHKKDRAHYHFTCDGELRVVSNTGTDIVSCCKLCGLCVRSTLTNCIANYDG